MSARKYTWVVSWISWPSHSAMTVRSTPEQGHRGGQQQAPPSVLNVAARQQPANLDEA
jgi:hypothetical protein